MRALLAVLAALNGAGPVVAEPREAAWHAIEVWRQPQGLPQNSVLAVIQTHDGYLWVGTKGGVARFDGVRFTTYDDRTKTELLDSEVQALAEGDDGALWVGTYGGGLTRLKDGVFTTYTTRDGLPHDFVFSLCKDAGGSLWIGTTAGLSRFRDGRFTSYTTRDGLDHNTVVSLFAEPDGGVLAGTSGGGVFQVREGRLAPVPGLPRASTSVRAIVRDGGGALWLATNAGLLRWKDGLTRYTTEQGLRSNRVARLHLDVEGNLWVGTTNGLNRIRDGELIVEEPGHALTDANISGLVRDREGNLWVGYFDEGLARLRRGQFQAYRLDDGLPHPAVRTVFEDRKGTVWIGGHGGLAVYRDGHLRPVAHRFSSPAITAVAQDPDGRLWVGTELALHRSTASADCVAAGCRLQFSEIPTGLSRPHPRALVFDRAGVLWIGTDTDGLLRYEDGRLTRFTSADGLAHDEVKAIAEAPDGTLWIGTKYGLTSRRDGRFQIVSRKDGLVSDALEGLHVDADGTLWAATRQGLVQLRDGRFTTYTVAHGLFSSLLHDVRGDDHGYLWITCPKGIFRVRRKELEDVAAGHAAAFTSVLYGIEHGLPSTVVSGGYASIAKARDGRLWFATARGAAAVDPSRLDVNLVPPPAHIEEVVINGGRLDPKRAARVSPGRGDITIRYTGLTFLAAHKVAFRYRLEGYDAAWIDAGPRREVSYTNIPSGAYTFRVQAANSDGIWNEQGAAFSFHLEPHFHETGWFYLLAAGGVVLAGVALHFGRTRRLRARERQLERSVQQRTRDLEGEIQQRRRIEEALRLAQAGLEQRVQERTAELAEVNETLRASLTEKEVLLKEIHHRVRNNLQIVSSLLNLQSEHVEDEATLAALRDSQDRVRAMAQIHEKLYQSEGLARIDAADYVRSVATTLFTSYGVRADRVALHLDVEAVRLGLDTAIPCGLIINELISNALKHAFPDGRRGELRVGLRSAADGRLALDVSDDGVGISDGFELRRSRSLGLQLVQALTDQLDGEVEIRRDDGRTTFAVRFRELKYKERLSR